jgi:hypothetical protein
MKKNSLPTRLTILKLAYLDVVDAYRNCNFETILSIDFSFNSTTSLSKFAIILSLGIRNSCNTLSTIILNKLIASYPKSLSK